MDRLLEMATAPDVPSWEQEQCFRIYRALKLGDALLPKTIASLTNRKHMDQDEAEQMANKTIGRNLSTYEKIIASNRAMNPREKNGLIDRLREIKAGFPSEEEQQYGGHCFHEGYGHEGHGGYGRRGRGRPRKVSRHLLEQGYYY